MTETVEDWFGLVVEDDGTVWGIRYDGEQQWHFGTDEKLYRDLLAVGFPLQCDTAPGDGHLFVDFSVRPSILPLADVTAYSQGPAPREHPMGAAGVVVHRWLEQHPDVTIAARESVGTADSDNKEQQQ